MLNTEDVQVSSADNNRFQQDMDKVTQNNVFPQGDTIAMKKWQTSLSSELLLLS